MCVCLNPFQRHLAPLLCGTAHYNKLIIFNRCSFFKLDESTVKLINWAASRERVSYLGGAVDIMQYLLLPGGFQDYG